MCCSGFSTRNSRGVRRACSSLYLSILENHHLSGQSLLDLIRWRGFRRSCGAVESTRKYALCNHAVRRIPTSRILLQNGPGAIEMDLSGTDSAANSNAGDCVTRDPWNSVGHHCLTASVTGIRQDWIASSSFWVLAVVAGVAPQKPATRSSARSADRGD